MTNENKHFKKLYNFMLHSNEFDSPLELLVYAIIYAYPCKCFSGRQEFLAKICKVKNTKTIRKALNSLKDKGLIAIHKNVGGKYNSNRKYEILRDSENIIKIDINDDIYSEYIEFLGVLDIP